MKRNLLLLLILAIPVIADAQFRLDAELRPRAEMRDGYKTLSEPGKVPAWFISQRTRLAFGWSGDKTELRITPQDVRVWGDETSFTSTGVTGDPASLDLYEAWLKYSPLKNLSFKIGRQEWDIYDTRLISIRNWNQTGITYDGLLAEWTSKFGALTAGLSWNNDKENSFGNIYTKDKIKTLDFLYWKMSPVKILVINLLYVAAGFQKENAEAIYLRHTVGGGLDLNLKNTIVRVTPYYQFGQNKSGVAVSAWFLSARIEQKFSQLKIMAGVDLLSGQDASKTTGKDHLFDILYGNRHSVFGFNDYFSNVPLSTGNRGLGDAYLKLEKAFKQSAVQIWYHFFTTNQTVINDQIPINKFLGHEVDLVYKQKLTPALSFEAGYGFMLPTATMEILNGLSAGGSDFSHFGYLMIIFKPQLFSTK
ncbi:MAG: alginate export family protein [Bacteroidales bacterium]